MSKGRGRVERPAPGPTDPALRALAEQVKTDKGWVFLSLNTMNAIDAALAAAEAAPTLKEAFGAGYLRGDMDATARIIEPAAEAAPRREYVEDADYDVQMEPER